MENREIENLFHRFAAPLVPYAATSKERKDLATILAKSLWAAMIAGPAMEDEIWMSLQTTANLNGDSLQAIKELYLRQMRPSVSEEQLAALRNQLLTAR